MAQHLANQSLEVASLLKATGQRLVLAESCTGGLVAATLARVPGISEYLCGSAVVYRLDTKAKWLGVSESMLIDPGPVSEVVARAMVRGVLAKTPEATLAASITGHLGPNAPVDQDGLVFVGIGSIATNSDLEPRVQVFEHRLTSDATQLVVHPGISVREQRQWLGVQMVLEHIAAALNERSR